MDGSENRRWYIVQTYSGYENRVKANLEQRIATMGMDESIFNVLVPVEERLQWRDALSLHLLHQMRSPSGFPLPKWKIEEQVVPMNLVVAGLLEQGVVADPQILEEQFGTEGTIRSDYASGK